MASVPAPVIVDELIHQDDAEPATPASEAATSSVPEKSNLSLDPSGAVGLWVRLIKNTGDTLEGLLYAYDTILGAVVLQCLPSGPASAKPTPDDATPAPEVPPATTKTSGKPMSFAAAAAAAASRSASTSPTPRKRPSASSSPSSSPSQAANGASTPSGPMKYDFHIVKLSSVKEIEPLARSKEEECDADSTRKSNGNVPRPLPNLVPVGHIQIDKAIAREQAAVARIGVGVSSVAQVS